MTNVYSTPDKVETRNRLFEIGVEALQKDGWRVEKVQGAGKASVRRITKQGQSRIVSIRTTQDTYIAFPRTKNDQAWVTLSDVDAVVAVSVNDRENPKFALVHFIEGQDMRDRFDRAYAARKAAGHKIPLGRGVWLPLYIKDSNRVPAHVGGGAGLDNKPIAQVPLEATDLMPQPRSEEAESGAESDQPLTLAEAKRRLALTFGVDPSNIKIIVDA